MQDVWNVMEEGEPQAARCREEWMRQGRGGAQV